VAYAGEEGEPIKSGSRGEHGFSAEGRACRPFMALRARPPVSGGAARKPGVTPDTFVGPPLYGSVMADEELQQQTRSFVRDLLMATITMPSSRDEQRMPGPSDLADPCDVCVAHKIALSCGMAIENPNRRNFSLKAWNGTAVHQKIERDLPRVYKHAEQEITVVIGEVEGLGTIKGHIDLYLPLQKAMCDWKTTDLKKLNVYRTTNVPSSHFGQTMLYMHGLRVSGREAEVANLAYIPRDSNKTSDIWVASCSFREDIALGLLERAAYLTDLVRSGRAGGLEPDAGCFVCIVQPRLR
jgi:hypothetical protein